MRARLGVTNALFFHYFNEMGDLGNHAARLRRIDQFGDAAREAGLKF